MRKTTILLLVLLGCFNHATAQIEVIGSEEFGRIFDVTYDANIENRLYAITLSNHILRSDDNGESWSVMFSHQDAVTISGLKYIESENALSYYTRMASWAPYGYGLFIFDLDSQTITKEFHLPDQSADSEWISAYDLWEQNTDVALVVQGYKIGLANFSKVQYTTNGGSDWHEVYFTAENLNIFPNQVAIHPNDQQRLFITLGNGDTDTDGGLWLSTDGGQNWEDIIPGIIFDPITFNPNNPDEILLGTGVSFGASPENLYHSFDAGNSWEIIPIEWTDYLMDNITYIAFNPNNTSDIIVLEDNEVVISDDGGETWQVYVYENASDNPEDYYYGLKASYNPFDENEVYVSGNYYPLFSGNKGASFVRIKTPFYSATGPVELYSDNTDKHLFYGVQYGYVHKDLISGVENSYSILPINMMTINEMSFKIDKHHAGKIFTFESGFMGSDLYVSNDFGETKHQLLNIFSNSLDYLATSPYFDDIAWASFSSFGSNIEMYQINFENLNNVQTFSLNIPEQSVITGIAVDPSNSDHMIIASGANIYQTFDGANSWESTSTGLGSVAAILSFEQNPLNPDQFTIGTDAGIFTSTDGGNNWNQLFNSLVHHVQHSTVVDGHLMAAVRTTDISNFAIYYSTDQGDSWETISNKDLYSINAYFAFFDFQEDVAEAYINTTDLGLLKVNIDLTSVGIKDPDFSTDATIKLYPNPITDFLYVQTKEKIESVSVYDLSGKLILTSDATVVDLNQVKQGFYLVQVQTKTGQSFTEKVIRK